VPELHGTPARPVALVRSLLGLAVGGGLVYLVRHAGKLLFGRQKLELPQESLVVFTETALVLPDREVPYEEIFYRDSDTITLEAKTVELIDRCYRQVTLQLSPERLRIGEEEFDPEQVPQMEVVTERMVLPREAMGFGDVKFMAAIGAFLGWQATVFSLMLSSIIGALVGVTLIVLRKQQWSSRIPYGPYIALAAALWIFGGQRAVQWWLEGGWLR
jgi:leader peptidase (prepilin peptidase)/N-methyltransferase